MRILEIAALVLLAAVIVVVTQTGSELAIECVRQGPSKISCLRQWRMLGLIPLGPASPFDLNDLQKTCYMNAADDAFVCNYGIDEAGHTLPGNGAEPVDLFLNGETVSLNYDLRNPAFFDGVVCIALPLFVTTIVLAALLVLFRLWSWMKTKSSQQNEIRACGNRSTSKPAP